MSKTSKPSSSNQSKNGNEIETFDASEYEFNISASLMSKILEDSIQDTVTKHCDTCTCNKTQNKPFCYNESYYSVATQTLVSGEMKNSLCLNCNSEIKSLHSNLSMRSTSPHGIKLVNDKSTNHSVTGPLYIIPQQIDTVKENQTVQVDNIKSNCATVNNKPYIDEKIIIDSSLQTVALSKVEEITPFRKKHDMNMEPAVHHKLCDRTKTSVSSKKSSSQSVGHDDLLIPKEMPNVKNLKLRNDNKSLDNTSIRKNSNGSMGAISRTSSLAKSTVSTHKSNTQVGPGPRFCHLRMQAGSKNILLDNAEPDVPPILYRRQSKCHENSLFKDLNDDLDNFVDIDKNDDDLKDDPKNDNVVIESTLIDVHVDNNNKECNSSPKNSSINPVLLNVSSSPLQPLKTHNISNSSEHYNNNSQSICSQQNVTDIDNLLNDFNVDVNNTKNNNITAEINDNNQDTNTFAVTDNHVKIFNFDRYEQNKLSTQYNKPLRKIDMSQLYTLENTRISKDLSPAGDNIRSEKKIDAVKSVLPPIVNVYPNLTQTHLKVNDNNKVFTNEQSTSSLSSDDSAAVLQKQQLLRVAEWVEKNLEQQNNFNDPLEEDANFANRTSRRDSKLCRLTETLHELALSMPHPVSKYSKSCSRDNHNNTWVHNNAKSVQSSHEQVAKHITGSSKIISNVIKETIFPVESGDVTVTEISKDAKAFEDDKVLDESFKPKKEKKITPEDLARMEYNVKKFLLSGPHWVNPGSVGRSRRTSSKTETDV